MQVTLTTPGTIPIKIKTLKSSPQMTVPKLHCPDFYVTHWNLIILELSVSGVHELGPSQTSLVPSLPCFGSWAEQFYNFPSKDVMVLPQRSLGARESLQPAD